MENMKKTFSRIGIAYTAYLLTSEVLSFIIDRTASAIGIITYDSRYILLVSVVCNYLVGLPVLYLHLRRLDTEEKEKGRITAGSFIKFFVIAEGLGFFINILSNIFAGVISDWTAVNPIADIVELNAVTVIATVMLAPVFEELMFRKMLIDRTVQYGEKTAMIVSGLMFGLFHTNFYQMLYAFAIGMILAYIYIRTRDIRYSIGLHALFNFFGGIVPLIVSRNYSDDLVAIAPVTEEKMTMYLTMLIPVLLFIVFEAIMSVCGIVLAVRGVKKMKFDTEKEETGIKNACRNTGMIIYVISSIVFTVLTFI